MAARVGRPTDEMALLTTHDELADLEVRARAGDTAAFGALLRRHDHDLRGVVWSVVRDHHAVDDVMQDAYERAYRSLDRFEGRSSLKTWLHSVCYRTAIDHTRYEGRRRHEPIDHLRVVADPAPDTVDATVAGVTLEQLLSSIEPEERALLMLTAGLGHSFDEVAEITGLPRGTVASRVSRLRSRLRGTP